MPVVTCLAFKANSPSLSTALQRSSSSTRSTPSRSLPRPSSPSYTATSGPSHPGPSRSLGAILVFFFFFFFFFFPKFEKEKSLLADYRRIDPGVRHPACPGTGKAENQPFSRSRLSLGHP